MSKLVCSPNTPFCLEDWEKESIVRLFAGKGCVMALTAGGRVLQKIRNPELAARTLFWRNVADIHLSGLWEGLAIGLLRDGTAMVAKRPLRRLCQDFLEHPALFDEINNTIRQWSGLRQVVVSDAFFALDCHGRVQYVPLTRGRDGDDYREVAQWQKVVRLVPHIQNGIMGITAEGRVLTAGANFRDRFPGIQTLREVVDGVSWGTDWPHPLFLCRDGTLRDEDNHVLKEGLPPDTSTLCAHFWGILLHLPEGSLDKTFWQGEPVDFPPVEQIAAGSHRAGPFVVGMAAERQ